MVSHQTDTELIVKVVVSMAAGLIAILLVILSYDLVGNVFTGYSPFVTTAAYIALTGLWGTLGYKCLVLFIPSMTMKRQRSAAGLRTYFIILTVGAYSMWLISVGANFNLAYELTARFESTIRLTISIIIAAGLGFMLIAVHKQNALRRSVVYYLHLTLLGLATMGGTVILLNIENQKQAVASAGYLRLEEQYNTTAALVDTLKAQSGREKAGIKKMQDDKYYTRSEPYIASNEITQNRLKDALAQKQTLSSRLTNYESGDEVFFAAGLTTIIADFTDLTPRAAMLIIMLWLAFTVELMADSGFAWREKLARRLNHEYLIAPEVRTSNGEITLDMESPTVKVRPPVNLSQYNTPPNSRAGKSQPAPNLTPTPAAGRADTLDITNTHDVNVNVTTRPLIGDYKPEADLVRQLMADQVMQQLLQMIVHNPQARVPDLVAAIPRSESTVKRYINKLKQAGVISGGSGGFTVNQFN